MSTQVSAQPSARAQDNANTRRGGNRGRGGANMRRGNPRNPRGGKPAVGNTANMREKEKDEGDQSAVQELAESKEEAPNEAGTKTGENNTEGGEENICWICAEPVKYWSVPECNHRTCHVCALRLRALYKKTDCTFCKEPQSSVIFTSSPDTEFALYKPDDIPHKDVKLEVHFETHEMMEETLILLKFNCPDPSCDYIGNGWGDLKLHTRAVHGRLMCDLCIRHKKVFAHEHALYAPSVLPVHLPSMHHRHVKQVPKDKVEGGVHPMCEFCRECFFDVDEHYSHMREKHEECFVCKRNGVQFQYFQNYESLERHFNTAHHPCAQPECRERKFVVFNTSLDLQGHMVEEHGANMSSRDKKDARKVQADFQFEEIAAGSRQGRRGGGTRERDREPPPGLPPPRSQAGPSDTARLQPPANPRRAAFGSSLTGSDSAASLPVRPSPSGSSSPLIPDVDPSVAERHAVFISRLQSLAQNPASAVPVVRAALLGYRASESSARDLILTIFNVLSNNLEHTASIVNGLVDLVDEEEKKQDLLASWRGFSIEQRRQFPDLVPQSIGGEYAGITSGRVLNAKNSTASRSSQPSRQVWDRVAAAASSSTAQPIPQPRTERFPPLLASTPAPTPAFRQPIRTTPWSASANAGARAPTITVEPRSIPASKTSQGKQPRPPKLDNTVFPELPSSSAAREKPKVSGNVSLKNILGNSAPSASAWHGDGGTANSSESAAVEGEDAANGNKTAGKGKKGKGKQKQTLFTLGTFPT